MKPNADIKLISGNANQPLAEIISNKLFRPLTKARVERFADDETVSYTHLTLPTKA